MELHRGMEDRQQPEMTNVADEDATARRHQLHGLLQYLQEVVEVREVLHDRVQDHRVEGARLHTAEICGVQLGERNVLHSVPRLEPRSELSDRRWRDIRATIQLAGGRKMLQEQPDAAADLQHTTRP